MAHRRYIFFDIDGTLVAGGYGDNCYIPDSTKEALKKLKQAGHFLCIATGRAQAMAVDYMHELGFDNMVSDGGYGITINDKLLGITPLPKDKIVKLIDECKREGFAWGIQPDNSWTRKVPDSRFVEVTHDVYMKSEIVENLDPRNYDAIYKAYIACPAPQEERLETLKELPWCRFFKEYLYVEPADKAYGIKKIMDYYKADYKDAIVFGDAKNDISMFKDSWTKVAMGNAIPELKELSDYVTTDVDKDGIYNACLKLGLFEKVTSDN